MITKRTVSILLGVYALVRVFSYFFGPKTPLQDQHIVNTIVALLILGSAAFFLVKKDVRGWYIIILELILGGSGNYLAAFGLTLRTWLLIISLPLFSINLIRDKALNQWWQEEKKVIWLFVALYTVIIFGITRGLEQDHHRALVMGDATPYLFLLYYFPFKQLIKESTFTTTVANALVAAIIGNTLLILGTFIGYASHILVLQDSYYHWYRDVAGGKITEIGSYYRLVLNEHLLLIPVLLWLSAQIIKKNQTKLYAILAGLLILVLSFNLTRAYLLALAIGYLFLFSKKTIKRWFTTGASLAILFVISFTSMHLLASRGTSLGWELFGVRLQSIVTPSSEDSSLSRLLLLPKIMDKIKAEPLKGYGLGDTVTVYSPVFKKEVTTPHFDWGYLEIMAELGIMGVLVWLALIAMTFIRTHSNTTLIATLVALLVINLTSPALFHVLGLLWIAFLLTNKKTLNQSV